MLEKIFTFSITYLNILFLWATNVMIWEPYGENIHGHVSIQTKEYYISLWPDGKIKNDFGIWKTLTEGVQGCLISHHDYDRDLEHKRDPKIYFLENISDSKANQAYEDMLAHNDITPDRATLETAEDMIQNKKKPEISLPKTLYSFKGDTLSDKEFYKKPQSCTTFSSSLLNIANEGIIKKYYDDASQMALHYGGWGILYHAHYCNFLDVRTFHSMIKKISNRAEERCCVS